MTHYVVRKGLSRTWYVLEGAEIISRHSSPDEAQKVADKLNRPPKRLRKPKPKDGD